MPLKKDSTQHASFTESLLADKRLFTVLSDQVKDYVHYDPSLYALLVGYVDSYTSYHKLTSDQVAKGYQSFIRSYNKDARLFDETGKYPLEIDADRAEPSRTDYSVILLLSTLLTSHRFRIMQLIMDKVTQSDSSLIIGCGPGLEIELVRARMKEIVAYDLTLDSFLDDYYKGDVDFRKEFFDGSGEEDYDNIFLIELLEHLDDPYKILADSKKVLKKGGVIYLTTATNIPQFDHLYNFSHDHLDFEKRVQEMGYSIVYSEEIVHAYMTKGIGSMNKFYTLTH